MNIKIISNNSNKSRKVKEKIMFLIKKFNFKTVVTKPELIIAIGGDGTFLKALKETAYDTTPYYIGINTGHLGFLQELNINNIEELFLSIKNKNFKTEHLYLADINIFSKNTKITYNALNEIVLREQHLKVFKANINLNNSFLERFAGDGLLISTPTGTTAYNLSAGGSIVYPNLEVLQLLPLAPLPFSNHYKCLNSPIILPKNVHIEITPNRNITDKVSMVLDGENYPFCFPIQRITVNLSDKYIKVLKIKDIPFSDKLNEKFINI